jgi:hypothetical protein
MDSTQRNGFRKSLACIPDTSSEGIYLIPLARATSIGTELCATSRSLPALFWTPCCIYVELKHRSTSRLLTSFAKSVRTSVADIPLESHHQTCDIRRTAVNSQSDKVGGNLEGWISILQG